MKYRTPKLSQFKVLRSQGWIIYLHAEFPSELAQWILANMGSPEAGGLEPVAASRYARVFQGVTVVQGQRYHVFVKHYLHRSLIDLGKHLFRPGRAMRALEASALLNACDLHCPVVMSTALHKPSVLGWPGLRRLPLCLKSVAVTLAVENTSPLYVCLRELNDRLIRRRFLRALGREIGQMHAQGIFHGDLRTGNVLIQTLAHGWRFWFLDNERTRRFRVLPKYLVVRNLVQLHIYIEDLTNTDRYCFFQAYQEVVQQTRLEQRRLVRQVWEKTRKRVHSRMQRTDLRKAQATWV